LNRENAEDAEKDQRPNLILNVLVSAFSALCVAVVDWVLTVRREKNG
jgi:hypothetical protein